MLSHVKMETQFRAEVPWGGMVDCMAKSLKGLSRLTTKSQRLRKYGYWILFS